MAVAIIGCGGTGAAIAAQLAKYKNMERMVLADSNLNTAENVSSELRKLNDNVDYEAYQVNADKESNIERILKDVKVVINAASPVCNIPIMNACIKSKSNYIDLASDPFIYPGIKAKTAIDYQLELHDSFVKNDLISVTNAGASPGFSDLLCKHAVQSNLLDSIQHVKIYFIEIIESDRLISSWSPYILMLESILPATIFKGNAIVELDTNQRRKQVEFPSPFGKIEITLFNGHPELRTIPEFINVPVEHIEVGGSTLLNDMRLDDIIIESLRRKVKENMIFNGDIFEILATSFESPEKFIDYFNRGIIKKEVLCSQIEIKGKKKDKSVIYHASTLLDFERANKNNPLATASSYMVSIVPTIITNKIIEGKIIEKGVIAPAALSIASDIIEESEKYDICFRESVELS